MNIEKLVYWIATALLAVGMLGSGIAQIIQSKAMIDLITPLGYPTYLLYIIGFWKILAVIAILSPGLKLVKEWAYAGLFFVMTGALISHLAIGNYDIKAILGPTFQTGFIILSWYYRPADRRIVSIN